MSDWKEYKVTDLPEGVSGDWTIKKFEISKKDADFENMRASFSFSSRGAYYVPGIYTRLKKGGTVVMSDTFDEIQDHRAAIRNAKGKCLIGGLGLGVVANGCLLKPEVEHVTVIDLSEDVIKLVSDHYKKKFGDRLTIIHGDVMEWKPPKGERYGMVWMDIWDGICEDNLPSMGTLNRRYARKSDWKGCWKQEEIVYYRDR